MIEDQLTIRIEAASEFVAVEDFVSVITDTVQLLTAVGECLKGDDGKKIQWRVSGLSLNSPATVTLFADTEDRRVSEIISASTQGLRHLDQQAPGRPRFFSDEVLDLSKRLVRPLGDELSRITFLSDYDVPLTPSQCVAAQADLLLPKPHEEYGTIEGRLESISTHQRRVFGIWDVFTNARVECRFSSNLLSDARDALTHRVAVTGRIYYNRQGEPVSIAVDEIRQLREQRELPQFKDLERIALKYDGDPAEAMRRAWDGD